MDTRGNFCKAWELVKIVMLSYTFYVSPFILVFPSLYETCSDDQGKKLDDCFFKTRP